MATPNDDNVRGTTSKRSLSPTIDENSGLSVSVNPPKKRNISESNTSKEIKRNSCKRPQLITSEDYGDISAGPSSKLQDIEYARCDFPIECETNPVEEKTETEDLRLDVSKIVTTKKTKYCLLGYNYQLALLTLVSYRAYNKAKNKFYITSEVEQYGHFEDIVIDHGTSMTFVQVKHSAIRNKYNEKDFCKNPYKGNSDSPASLTKYFDSWYNLNQSGFLKTPNGNKKVGKYIFFTNCEIEIKKGQKLFLESTTLNEDEFAFERLEAKTFKFKKERRKQFSSAIFQFSEVIKNKVEPTRTKLEEKDNGKLKIKIDDCLDKFLMKVEQPNNDELSAVLIDEILLNTDIADSELTDLEIRYIKESYMGKKCIDDFLDEFIIKVEQSNSDKLSALLKKEIRFDTNISASELTDSFISYMKEQYIGKKLTFLSSEGIGNLIEVTKWNFDRHYFLGGTLTYQDECENGVISCKELGNIKDLNTFLGNNHVKHVAIIGDKGGGIKQKVYNTVTSMNKFKVDEWSFLTHKSIFMSKVPDILKGETTKFVIIDCRESTNFRFIKDVLDATIENNKQLILLIKETQKEDVVAQIEQGKGSDFYDFDSDFLSDVQVERICSQHEDKYISLAEKDYKIQDIIDNKLIFKSINGLMRDADYLEQMIKYSHEEVPKMESKMPYGIYIQNEIKPGEEFYDLSIISRKIVDWYIIEGIEYNNLLSSLKSFFETQQKTFSEAVNENALQTEFILMKHDKFVDSYLSQTLIFVECPVEFKEKTYIHLKGESTENLKVVEKSNNVYFPFPKGIDYSNPLKQEVFREILKTNCQLSVITSSAGYGKTSFCQNILETHQSSKDVSSLVWVVKVALPELQFNENENPVINIFSNEKCKWEEKAFNEDCETKGRVLFILDGFDEVKNDKIVKQINSWISCVHENVSVLVTTREYAANKLVLPNNKITKFYKLTEYTEKQCKNYIEKYITEILEETEKNTQIDIFDPGTAAEKTINKLNARSSKILGIPLESYIFCEVLKPYLLEYVENNDSLTESKFSDMLKNLHISNTVLLYQEFIFSKSKLFLAKHLGIKLESVREKAMVFNLLGSYNQILELYALKQAFDLDDITEFMSGIYFDAADLKPLQDTGLLIVSEDNSKLNFNHETYQEFYAALAVIRGLLSKKGGLYESVKTLVKENRYNPKFNFMFSIASQFSIVGGPLIPCYNKQDHLLAFWDVLGTDGDVIGAGAIRCFKNCTSELSEDDSIMLMYKTQIKKWAKFFIKAIQDASVRELEYQFIQFKIRQDFYFKEVVRCNVDNKNMNAPTFKEFLGKGMLNQKAVEELIEKIRLYKDKDRWPVLAEFLQAIGLTGQYFNRELADYLLLRGSRNLQYECIILAVQTIYQSLGLGDSEAKQNCFYVINNLIYEVTENNDVISLLNIVENEYMTYLINSLHQFLEEKECCMYWKNNPFSIIENIILLAEMLQYAVEINLVDYSILLTKHQKFKISFEKDVLKQTFAKKLVDILNTCDSESTKKWVSNLKLGDEVNLVKNENGRRYIRGLEKNYEINLVLNKIERCYISELKKDGLNQYFDAIKYRKPKKLVSLFQILDENGSVTREIVDKLTKIAKEQTDNFWSFSCGIETIGYTGIYFNQDLANFLKDSPCKEKTAVALKKIDSTLIKYVDKSNEDFKKAERAYNECMQDSNFNNKI